MKSTLNTSRLAVITLLLATLYTTPAHAQTTDHSNHNAHTGHDMSQMDHSKMEHSGMDHSRMSHDEMMEMRAKHMVDAHGVLVALNTETREATIRHGDITSISWPAAEMIFPVGAGVDLSGLAPGQNVQFTLHRAADGSLPLVELCPAAGAAIQPGLCMSKTDHSGMNHSDIDHSQMDHGQMDHGSMSGDTVPSSSATPHAHGAHK
jgi:Cu/Ag efflux protein CusF